MRHHSLGWLLLTATLTGCGGLTQPAQVASVGSHQGRLLNLPDGLGSVEVVVEIKANPPQASTPEVVAYFLGPDSQSPMQPPPTDVVVQVYLAEAKTLEKVPMKPEATAGQNARFAAVPPPGFDGIVRSGRINARLAGREIDLPF